MCGPAADHNRKLAEAVTLAEAEFQRRHDIYSSDTLAWTYYKGRRLTETKTVIIQALRLGTPDASLFFHAGMIVYDLRKHAEAKTYLRRALKTNPHFSLFGGQKARDTLALLETQTVARGEVHVQE